MYIKTPIDFSGARISLLEWFDHPGPCAPLFSCCSSDSPKIAQESNRKHEIVNRASPSQMSLKVFANFT